ncbi:MAG: CBS domain-containing protein [Actinomycetota bacterium]|nr:CBS domain-containing protein [Actinomycetota bacterium]
MKVKDWMTEEVITLSPADPIRRAAELMDEKRLRRFPVIEKGRLVGIVTDRDFRNATASSVVLTEKRYHDFLLDSIRVESIMTPNPRAISPEADLAEAARIILEMKVGGLPVVSGEKLVGIITETDLIKVLIDLLSRGKELS